MKNILLFSVLILLPIFFFSSCSDVNNDQSASSFEASAPSDSSVDLDEEGRKIIKTASIDLEVKQLEKAVLDLKAFLKPIHATVYNYEIDNESYEQDSYQHSLDSSVIVSTVNPKGSLSIKVPIAQADTFINYILSSDAQIAHLLIHDEDVTEDLWEKEQTSNVYSKSAKAGKGIGSSKNIGFDNSTSIDAIKARASAAALKHKTNYLWFDIHLRAQPFVQTKTTFAPKVYRTPIHIGLVNAVSHGWHLCADIILALIGVWPVLLLIGLVYFLVRKYKFKTT